MSSEIYKIEQLLNKIAIVFSISYVNPISYLPSIERDLMDFSGTVILDLLLCNGNSSNRFVEAIISNGRIERKSMKVFQSSDLDQSIIDKIQQFYEAHTSVVKNSNILN